MKHQFPVAGPLQVYAEVGAGALLVTAEDDPTARVVVEGDDDVRVDQEGTSLTVLARRRAGFGSRGAVTVRITVPRHSTLVAELGAASLGTRGVLDQVRVTTGSGSVDLDVVSGAVVVKTGSGSFTARHVGGPTRVKAGSGSLRAERLDGEASLVTGSGSVEVDRATGSVTLKSGSGDVVLGAAGHDTRMVSTSGDLAVGHLSQGRAELRTASGDVRLGIARGTPVWTDLRTTSGQASSTLPPVGPPAPGQDFVRVRAVSVSGDIHLHPAEAGPNPEEQP